MLSRMQQAQSQQAGLVPVRKPITMAPREPVVPKRRR
jgi:hypothetical protein